MAHLVEGQKTLDVALSIASPDAAIILLYVMEDIPNWTDLDLPPDFKENSMLTIRALQVEVRAGHAYSTVLKEAEAMNVDLIILASHKPGLKEYFIGSNTSKVVNHTKCSVVVLRLSGSPAGLTYAFFPMPLPTAAVA